jgi:hypothetical protein
MKQQITIEVDIPEGWEATGEYRKPTDCDHWLPADGGPVIRGAYPFLRVILRKRQPPIADDAWPDWVAEGAWYGRDEDGDAYLYKNKPFTGDSSFRTRDGEVFYLEHEWPFPDFPHPPKNMPWEKTLCQKPIKERKNEER